MEATAHQPSARPSKQRILVVEDDANIARVLQLELEHEGFVVEVCGDGASAIERALKQPDLIVLDHDMPGLTGTEVAGIILGEQPDQAIVIFSGFATSPHVAAAVDLGVRAIIDKTRLTELPSLIRHTLSPTIGIGRREDRAV